MEAGDKQVLFKSNYFKQKGVIFFVSQSIRIRKVIHSLMRLVTKNISYAII